VLPLLTKQQLLAAKEGPAPGHETARYVPAPPNAQALVAKADRAQANTAKARAVVAAAKVGDAAKIVNLIGPPQGERIRPAPEAGIRCGEGMATPEPRHSRARSETPCDPAGADARLHSPPAPQAPSAKPLFVSCGRFRG
jgi:hypothetical protein